MDGRTRPPWTRTMTIPVPIKALLVIHRRPQPNLPSGPKGKDGRLERREAGSDEEEDTRKKLAQTRPRKGVS